MVITTWFRIIQQESVDFSVCMCKKSTPLYDIEILYGDISLLNIHKNSIAYSLIFVTSLYETFLHWIQNILYEWVLLRSSDFALKANERVIYFLRKSILKYVTAFNKWCWFRSNLWKFRGRKIRNLKIWICVENQ